MNSTLWKVRTQVVPWTLRDGALGAGLVIIGLVPSVILLAAVYGFWGADQGERTTVTLLVAALGAGLMVAAAWLFGLRKYRAPWSTLGFVKPHGRYITLLWGGALGLSLAFTALYAQVVSSLGIEGLMPPTLPDAFLADGSHVLFSALVLAVVTPLAEEVFFRGFLLGALLGRLGAARAIVASAVVFAIVHGQVGVIIPVFFTGLLLAWLYARTGSLWPPFMAHMGQNLLALWVSI